MMAFCKYQAQTDTMVLGPNMFSTLDFIDLILLGIFQQSVTKKNGPGSIFGTSPERCSSK